MHVTLASEVFSMPQGAAESSKVGTYHNHNPVRTLRSTGVENTLLHILHKGFIHLEGLHCCVRLMDLDLLCFHFCILTTVMSDEFNYQDVRPHLLRPRRLTTLHQF